MDTQSAFTETEGIANRSWQMADFPLKPPAVTRKLFKLQILQIRMDDTKRPKFKTIFLGPAGVGKTTMIYGRTDDQPAGAYSPTLNASHCDHTINTTRSGPVTLNLWDTAGSEQYRSLMSMYFRNARVAVLIFDLSQPSTLDALSEFGDQVGTHCPDNVIRVLVGNKSDKPREVKKIDAVRAQNALGCQSYFETCAYNRDEITNLLESIAESIPPSENIPEPPDTRFPDTRQEQKQKCQC